MPTPPVFSDAINRLWLPRKTLVACSRGVMGRNTLGVPLADHQRFNYFPASPLCGIGWWLQGTAHLLAPGQPVSLATPRIASPSRIVFGGPTTGPTTSWNPGPAHGLLLLLMPDAFHQMTGIDVGAWVNRQGNAAHVLPPDWMALCETVLTPDLDDDARVALVENFLESRWQVARPANALRSHRYQDWAHNLALRAASSSAGRSIRQVERRIKQWAGLPMRELRGQGRLEAAYFRALDSAGATRPHWADLAEQSGFADQSHLGRETRRLTGFAPDELYRRIVEDEGFWSYRLWQ